MILYIELSKVRQLLNLIVLIIRWLKIKLMKAIFKYWTQTSFQLSLNTTIYSHIKILSVQC